MMVKSKFEVRMEPVAKLMRTVGIDERGHFQTFYNNVVLHRMKKYMPLDSGALQKQTTISSTNTEIVTPGPQGHYLFMGKLWVDPITGKGAFYKEGYGFWSRPGVDKVPTERDLNFSKEKNPNAGPRWDLAVVENEGDAIVSDMQKEFDRHKGR